MLFELIFFQFRFLFIVYCTYNFRTYVLATRITMTTLSKNRTRFDARLSLEQKELFEKATLLSGYKSLTEFVLSTVYQKAKEIIQENEQILASKKDSELFFHTLMNTPSPNTALKKAAKRYKKLT